MQSFRHLVDRFYYGIQDRYSITLIGQHDAGKTSLLYLLKEGKPVEPGSTIPTIGFNFEIVRPPAFRVCGDTTTVVVDKGPVEVTMCEAGGGMAGGGGGSRSQSAFRIYAGRGDAVVWMVNSAESDWRFRDNVDELSVVLKWLEEDDGEDDDNHGGQKLNPRPLLILANKQDLPNARSVKEIRSMFAGILNRRPWTIVLPTSLRRGLGAESGIPQAFDWLRNAIKLSRQRMQNADSLMHRVPSLPSHRLQELNAWFSRLKDDVSPEVLLKQFEGPELAPRWDQYTKIRVIFHLLQKYDRQEGERKILKGMDKYHLFIADVPGEKVTLCVTMTSFWIQIVHFAILNDQKNPVHGASFTSFIAANPYVINENLWMEYYSKEAMTSRMAKDGLVLPDKKALPSIVFRNQLSSNIS